jgi:GMP synthase (glutamine-hydrolysing)
MLFIYFLAQELAWNLGGTVAKCEHREYGFARVQIKKFGSDPSRLSVDTLFEGLGDEMEVRVTEECSAVPPPLTRQWGFLL